MPSLAHKGRATGPITQQVCVYREGPFSQIEDAWKVFGVSIWNHNFFLCGQIFVFCIKRMSKEKVCPGTWSYLGPNKLQRKMNFKNQLVLHLWVGGCKHLAFSMNRINNSDANFNAAGSSLAAQYLRHFVDLVQWSFLKGQMPNQMSAQPSHQLACSSHLQFWCAIS